MTQLCNPVSGVPEANPQTQAVIACLAPEIPALSATFVYEELLGLKRRGFSVIPISVRRPAESSYGQAGLSHMDRFNHRDKRIKLFAAIAKRSAAYMVKQVAGQFDTISSTRAYCVRLTVQKKVVG